MGKGGTVNRRRFLAVAASVGVALTAGQGIAASQDTTTEQDLSGEISISGSSTVFPVSTAVAEEFQKMHSDVSISVSRDGTTAGFNNAFLPGNSDINNASRPIQPQEAWGPPSTSRSTPPPTGSPS